MKHHRRRTALAAVPVLCLSMGALSSAQVATDVPTVSIAPDVPVFFLRTNATILCWSSGAAAPAEPLAWRIECRQACPASAVSELITNGSSGFRRIDFYATEQWNMSVVTCYLEKYRGLFNTSSTIHVIGPSALTMNPDILSFAEDSLANITCAIQGDAAVAKATELDISWILTCQKTCPVSRQTRDADGVKISLVFQASPAWQSGEVACVSKKFPAISISRPVFVTPGQLSLEMNPGNLSFAEDSQTIITCFVRGKSQSTQASELNISWSLTCPETCPVSVQTKDDGGAKITLTFRVTPGWHKGEVACVSTYFPAINISNRMFVIPGEPNVTISVRAAQINGLPMVALDCRGNFGAASIGRLNWTVQCSGKCPFTTEPEVPRDHGGYSSLTFNVAEAWLGSTVTCFIDARPDVKATYRPDIWDVPTVSIAPNYPVFSLRTNATIFCLSAGAAAPTEPLAWRIECRQACPASAVSEFITNGSSGFRRIDFYATEQWNMSVITCYLDKHRGLFNTSSTIHVIGPSALAMNPDILSFAEDSLANITCVIQVDAAVAKATEMNIGWTLTCQKTCPISRQTRDADGVKITLVFQASPAWQSGEVACVSRKFSAISISRPVLVTPGPLGLEMNPSNLSFTEDSQAIITCVVRGESWSTDASELNISWSLMCPETCPVSVQRKDDGGAKISLTFRVTPDWHKGEVACVSTYFPAISISNQVFVVPGEPKVTIGVVPAQTNRLPMVVLDCRSNFAAASIGMLNWTVQCSGECPFTTEPEVPRDRGGYSSLTFNATDAWLGSTVTCFIDARPDVKATYHPDIREPQTSNGYLVALFGIGIAFATGVAILLLFFYIEDVPALINGNASASAQDVSVLKQCQPGRQTGDAPTEQTGGAPAEQSGAGAGGVKRSRSGPGRH